MLTSTRDIFDRKVLLIFTLIVFDAISTVYLMTKGYGEVNPALEWIANKTSMSVMATAKITWSLILLGLMLDWEELRRYIDYLIIGYVILYAGGWFIQSLWEMTR